jgi:hypothetical protein
MESADEELFLLRKKLTKNLKKKYSKDYKT